MGAYILGFISGILAGIILVEIISILSILFIEDLDDSPLYKDY